MPLTVLSMHNRLKWKLVSSRLLPFITMLLMAGCLQLFIQAFGQDRPSSVTNTGAPHEVSGTVMDESNALLPGISVSVKGTTRGTTTNSSGKYSLSGIEDNATLVFTGINIGKYEVKVNGRSRLSIVVKIKASELEEVVVNKGYYTTKKITNTGNVSTVTARDIERQPVSNILDALVGRVAGMQVTQKNGVAGAAPALLVRGQSSFPVLSSETNKPLILIDGVPVFQQVQISNGQPFAGSNGQLNNLLGINPQDVESVSVLKDADATSIYGARGANGVILITTKRNRGNGIKVNVNASTGFQKVGHFIDMLDIHQYLAMRREAFANDHITPDSVRAPDLYLWDTSKVHDWQRELIGKTSTFNDVNISMSGGNGGTHFLFSTAYHREGTVMPGNSKLSRKTFFTSINHVSDNRRLTFDVQSSYSTSELNLLSQDMVSFISYAPNYPLYNADGSLSWSGNTTHPYSNTLQKYALPQRTFTGNAKLSYEVYRGLKIRLSAGFTNTRTDMSWQQPASSLNPQYNPVSQLVIQNSSVGSWIVEPIADYSRSFKKHNLNLLAGGTFQKTYNNQIYIVGKDFANEGLISNLGSATTISSYNNSSTPYAFGSFYGRAGYNFNEEFLANFTFRRDGSARFGKNNRFGNFGAAGLGWVFTKEAFVNKMLPFLSYGKLRTSYGTSGTDDIPNFYYEATYSSGPLYNSSSLVPTRIENPNLKWETTKKFEAALELGVLKDRVLVSGSYFRNRSTNGLIYFQIAPQIALNYYVANYPSIVQNQGWEIELATRNIKGTFTWNTNLNLTRSYNKLIAFPNLENSSYTNTYILGKSLTLIKAYQLNGLDSAGKPVFVNIDQDAAGVISNKDRLYGGNRDPFFGGITNEFGYKGFNLSFFIQYSRNKNIKNYLPAQVAGTLNQNFSTYVLGRWQAPGDETRTNIPAYSTSNGAYNVNNYNNSLQNITTDNTFRLSNISLSYTIPASALRHLKMSQLQIYANAQNVYVWDKYKKYRLDPLSGNSAVPPLRTIVFGINASF